MYCTELLTKDALFFAECRKGVCVVKPQPQRDRELHHVVPTKRLSTSRCCWFLSTLPALIFSHWSSSSIFLSNFIFFELLADQCDEKKSLNTKREPVVPWSWSCFYLPNVLSLVHRFFAAPCPSHPFVVISFINMRFFLATISILLLFTF